MWLRGEERDDARVEQNSANPIFLKIGRFSNPALLSSGRAWESDIELTGKPRNIDLNTTNHHHHLHHPRHHLLASARVLVTERLEMNLTLSLYWPGSVRGCKKYWAGESYITRGEGEGRGGVNPTLGCNGISQYHKVTIANPQQFRYILL